MYEETCRALAVLLQKIVETIPELEALHPRASGMQALCELHHAVDKAKCFVKKLVIESKLYLAITSDSIFLKFKKVKAVLEQSLIGLRANFPEAYSKQIAVFLAQLHEITCEPDALYQEAGDKIVSLLKREKEDPTFNAMSELEVIETVALMLGIDSKRSLSAEKKALRRLFERVRREEDKRKELIVFYMLHLLRKYSKSCKLAAAENPDIESSCPPSPSERGSEASNSGKETDYSSELESSSIRRGNFQKGMMSCSDHRLTPPKELLCPISLQLMVDPVIVSSGQTYERVCIEKWFEEGHDTCPKTQHRLSHLDVTPNYCVKGLITSWCERHSLPFPSSPSSPPSVICDWRSDSFSGPAPLKDTNGQFEEAPRAGIEIDPVTKEDLTGEIQAQTNECPSLQPDTGCISLCKFAATDSYVNHTEMLLEKLHSPSLDLKYNAAEEIRFMTKENSNARSLIGQAGFIPLLAVCLDVAIKTGNEIAMETVCLALSNVAINNNRNRGELVSVDVLPLVTKLLDSDVSLSTKEAAIVLLLTASCLEANKICIASSGVVPLLLEHLEFGSPQGIKDVLATIFNLSTLKCSLVVNSGLISKLMHLLRLADTDLTEKCLAIIYTLVSTEEGRSSIYTLEGCISTLAVMLDNCSLKAKEHIVGILLVLCVDSPAVSQLVLEEGIIPSLVMLSANGTARGKDKASKLLHHFREQRQKESVRPSAAMDSSVDRRRTHVSFNEVPSDEKNANDRCEKRRKSGAFGFLRRSRSLAFYRCQTTASI